jgi:Cu(I)/Ag(I) efflux system membrane fusion protein/cobalt-zinc-cadmium efflux system membrane fusion protein
MNKYVLRTSLFWIGIFVLTIGVFLYRPRATQKKESGRNSGPQPVASGPAPSTGNVPGKPATGIETPLAPVQLTPEGMQSIGVKIGTVQRKLISGEIRATGTVDVDERRVSYIQIRFRGYIRKVFADATYQYVRKGEQLFTIYSPELVATEQDYLNALEDANRVAASPVEGVASAAKDVAAATEMRLRQWQIAASDLAKLKETGKLIPDLVVDSPVSGYITERNALPNLFVEQGTRLYTVADLSRVWVHAQVFQNDLGRLKPGDTAQITVDAYPTRTFNGRIESILPQVDMATRTVRVRLEIENPGVTLKPGMFVNVDLKTNLGRQLVVPASAVLQSGTRQLVFLSDGDGRIDPKEVVLGPRAGDDFVILKGLQAGEQIVTSANFLIDSESQLQAAAGSYAPPPPGAGGTAASQPAQRAQGTIDFTTNPAPPHKGSNVFRVKLSGPGGAAIEGAEVTVTFFMPAMPAMGMAAMTTTAKLTGKGNGLYEGTGILESGGSWQVTITARKDGNTIASKQLRMNAEGGM